MHTYKNIKKSIIMLNKSESTNEMYTLFFEETVHKKECKNSKKFYLSSLGLIF